MILPGIVTALFPSLVGNLESRKHPRERQVLLLAKNTVTHSRKTASRLHKPQGSRIVPCQPCVDQEQISVLVCNAGNPVLFYLPTKCCIICHGICSSASLPYHSFPLFQACTSSLSFSAHHPPSLPLALPPQQLW